MISMCAEQEEKFQFEHFSREDALKIGLKLHENAKEQPVAVEITVNGLAVFRYFAEGAKPDSELWLARKLDPNEYAAGGGFPIRLRGTGVIGSICVSGYPDHVDDHQLIINTLAEYFA